MKKISSLLIVSILVSTIVLSFCSCGKKGEDKPSNNESSSSQISDQSSKAESSNVSSNPASSQSSSSNNSKSEPAKTSSSTSGSQSGASISMNDALFIGDSRTIGLSEYSGLKSDFFASVGMSVYNIHKKPIAMPNVGKISLTDLLKNKKYGKIYVMLGINEIGYKLENTVQKYKELVELIRENQPNAYIFVQANLHVTAERSKTDKNVNNPNINNLNKEIAKLADGKKIIYLDANTVFDDASGNLAADKTSDRVHLYAKYYVEWAKWIETQTANMITGG